MKKVNFKNLEIKGVDWKVLNMWEVKLEQAIWNLLYNLWEDVNIAELWKRIYHWEEVELRDNEKTQIEEFVNSKDFPFIPLVKREIIKFMN